MRFYFLSCRPCALKVGGLYVGMVGSADVFLDISLDEGMLCELIPTDPKYLPLAFVLNDDFLTDPPLTTILCPTAILLKAEHFVRADSTLRLIAQREYPDCTASIFLQGSLQASVDRDSEVFTFPLTDDYERATIERQGDCILFIGEHHLTLVTADGEQVLSTPFITYSLQEDLFVTVPHFDSMNHYTEKRYRLTDGAVLTESKLLFRFRAKEELTLYALLESLLIDADVTEFVTETLAKRLSELKTFLGNYTSVLFITEDVAGLVYPVKKNLHRLTYFTAEYEKGKIDNIKEKSMES